MDLTIRASEWEPIEALHEWLIGQGWVLNRHSDPTAQPCESRMYGHLYPRDEERDPAPEQERSCATCWCLKQDDWRYYCDGCTDCSAWMAGPPPPVKGGDVEVVREALQYAAALLGIIGGFKRGAHDEDAAEHAIECERAVATLDRLEQRLVDAEARAEEHRKKWRGYEQDYILPCFKWAEEDGIDLQALATDSAGRNCVDLYVHALRQERDQWKARAEAAERILHDLTPGGSEYVSEPERCAEYLRQALNRGIDARKEMVRLQQAAAQQAPSPEQVAEACATVADQFDTGEPIAACIRGKEWRYYLEGE